MRDERFAELLESAEQGGKILRGDAEPSRAFTRNDVLLPVSSDAPDAVRPVTIGIADEQRGQTEGKG